LPRSENLQKKSLNFLEPVYQKERPDFGSVLQFIGRAGKDLLGVLFS